MSRQFILSVKISPNEYKHYEVPEPVYIYVKQLENAVRHPELSDKVKSLYKERFSNLEYLVGS
jgi:hypothetical protein